MTISTSTIRNDYIGNGVTDTYPYTFKAFASSDLLVYVDGVLQTITTHYTVTGVGVETGGNVEFVTPPGNALDVAIVATIPLTQTTDLRNQHALYQERIEERFDRLCRTDQIAHAGYISTLRPGTGMVAWTSGAGTPEGVVTAAIGSLFTRTDGGASTTLYVKESGTGNTGWVAK